MRTSLPEIALPGEPEHLGPLFWSFSWVEHFNSTTGISSLSCGHAMCGGPDAPEWLSHRKITPCLRCARTLPLPADKAVCLC